MKNFYTFLIAILVSGFGFGQNSEVSDPTPESQIPSGTISSLADTFGEAVSVFSFTITDADLDDLPTIVSGFRLYSTGTADLSNTIAGVTLTDVTNSLSIPLNSVPVTNPNFLNVSIPTGNLTVPDESEMTLTVAVWLKTTGTVVDNSTLDFYIDASDSDFGVFGGSSSIALPLAGNIDGNIFTIDVVATTLTFLQQPTDVTPGAVMTPNVQVGYTDANENVDVNFNFFGGITIANSNLFVSSSTFGLPFAGIVTFANLRFQFESSGEVLQASSTFVNTNLNSMPFDVLELPAQTTYTYNNGWNADLDPNGVSNPEDIIVVEAGNALIDTNTFIYTVTVEPGASLTVDSGTTFSVINNMTLQSVSNSYSSFIFNGSRPSTSLGTVIGGTVNYERFVNANSNGNDLISSPLTKLGGTGIEWQDFLNMGTNEQDLLSQGSDPIVYAFGPFKKDVDAYVNYTSATDGPSNRLNSGVGFRAATVADEDSDPLNGIGRTLTFSGDVRTAIVSVTVFFDPGPFADWNLIGNPYPSYISSQAFFNSTVASTTPNIDKITEFSGIYGYDGNASDGWDIITLVDPNRLIAPGQGFLIPAVAAGNPGSSSGQFNNAINFDNTMRTTGSSNDFILGRDASAPVFLKINASTADKNYKTQFYFNENASLGGDHGYDGRVLGTPPNFALYSHLVQDNTGLPMALQALHPSDLVETTVIPLGVNANQGEQITFSILESSLPDTIEVYLEDTVTNTFTLLNSGDYTLTPTVALNGTGRFYLRFGEGALSTTETTLADLNIYTNQNDKTIVIAGQLVEPTTASVYDIQGRLVNTTALATTSRTQTIDVSNLSSGVYVVQLTNGTQNKTQKVILR